MTRRYLAQLILRRLANGDVSDDFPIKEQEAAAWIDHGVAYAARANYNDNANVDVEYVGDGFMTTFKNLSLTKDSATSAYYVALPATPYGLPPGYDVAGVNLEGDGKLSTGMIRVKIQQLDYYLQLPMPPKAVFWWIEGKVLNLFSTWAILDGMKVRVRMASAGDPADLDAELNIPNDYVQLVIEYVMKYVAPTLSIAQDVVNDGNK